ncbi:MAG: hypothetical protein AAF433_01850 [Bacteroidota bacterium]
MKTAKLLFAGTCLFLVLWPMYRINSFTGQFKREGQSAAFLDAERTPFLDTIYASDEIIEVTRRIGYFNEFWTSAGIHLIHDPSLGREAIVRGPENVLKHLNFGHPMGGYGLHFKRPIVLPEDVEVRINLNAHHPGLLRLGFNGRNGRQVQFTTLGPVEAEVIVLNGCPSSNSSVHLEARYLFQEDPCVNLPVNGEINFFQSSFGQADRDFADLQLERAKVEQGFPHGNRAAFQADTVEVYYHFEGQESQNALTLLTDAPDTLYVPQGTEIELNYRHDDHLTGLDTALLVVRPLAEF